MSALNYTTRWPRGNARTAANKAIRLGLPGGGQILDASKLLTDAAASRRVSPAMVSCWLAASPRQ